MVESREPVTTEESLTEPDGRHDFYTVKFPLFDLAGNVEAVGGISLEITARKRAEEALRLNEARYRQAIMAAGAVPYYRDYRKSIHDYTFIGEGIQKLTGYSAAEITPAIFDRLEQECIMRGPLAHLTPDEAATSCEGKPSSSGSAITASLPGTAKPAGWQTQRSRCGMRKPAHRGDRYFTGYHRAETHRAGDPAAQCQPGKKGGRAHPGTA